MIFQKGILYIILLATINLIFCIPQQNDLIVTKNNILYSNSEQTEDDIQSIFELICEAVFDADIYLPVDEEAALLEKDFIGKRLDRNAYIFISQLTLLYSKIETSKADLITSYFNYNKNSARTTPGYSFIFRLTPF